MMLDSLLPSDIYTSLEKAYKQEGCGQFHSGIQKIMVSNDLFSLTTGLDLTSWLHRLDQYQVSVEIDHCLTFDQFRFRFYDQVDSVTYYVEDQDPPFQPIQPIQPISTPLVEFNVLRNKVDSLEILVANLTFRLEELERIIRPTTAQEVAKLLVD